MVWYSGINMNGLIYANRPFQFGTTGERSPTLVAAPIPYSANVLGYGNRLVQDSENRLASVAQVIGTDVFVEAVYSRQHIDAINDYSSSNVDNLFLDRNPTLLGLNGNLVASGPTFKSATRSGATLRLQFSETDRGLVIGQTPWRADGVEPLPTDRVLGFTIAGEDHQWHEADARIDGDSVIVASREVAAPVAVRYGWANAPRCNLYNSAGLPAAPFRTDDWPLPRAP